MNTLRRRVQQLSEILLNLKQNRAVRGTTTLILGTGVAKAIALITMPVLTRIYTPEDFGRLSVFVSVSTVLGSILTLRYVVAIPIPVSPIRARTLLLLNTVLVIALSAISAITVFSLLSRYGGAAVLQHMDSFWVQNLWIIFAGAFGFASYEVVTMWATREKRYSAISASQVWQSFTGTAVKIAAGLAFPSSLSLVVGQAVQQSGGLFSLFGSYSRAMRSALRSLNFGQITGVARRYLEFPAYKLPSHFIYALSAQAPILFSSYAWGAATTGQLGLAFQAIALPLALISQNASKVYYSELAALGRSDYQAALRLTNYLALRLFAVGMLISAALFLGAPFIFELAFGQTWRESGDFARALAVYIPFQFVASSLIMAYNIHGSQRRVLLVHFVRAALIATVFTVTSLLDIGALTTIYVYSAVISIHYAIVYYDVVRMIKLNRGSNR